MRHAVARGRAVGPRPGRVDVRGTAGASRAIQAALRDTVDRSPDGLAAVIADGDPMRDIYPLFDVADSSGGPVAGGVRPGWDAVTALARRRASGGTPPMFDA
jgi:hypothetical protein